MNQPLIVLVAPLAAEVAAAAAVVPVAAAAVVPVAAAVVPVAAAAVVSFELAAVTDRSTLPRPGIAWGGEHCRTGQRESKPKREGLNHKR